MKNEWRSCHQTVTMVGLGSETGDGHSVHLERQRPDAAPDERKLAKAMATCVCKVSHFMDMSDSSAMPKSRTAVEGEILVPPTFKGQCQD